MTSIPHKLIVCTRGSALARAQTDWVVGQLTKRWPDLQVRVEILRTAGDRIQDVALSRVGEKGLFVKELETALLEGVADLAVHSMKDLLTDLPEGLVVGAVPPREVPFDALVLPADLGAGKKLAAGLESPAPKSQIPLPPGARVGTSSLRRRAQLLHLRPDLEVLDLRGNIDTRLRKLDEGQCDAAVLAAAGLRRMGWGHRITLPFPPETMLPAPGQGALAVECRAEDAATRALLAPLDDLVTRTCVECERAFLRSLQGGCQVPIGALALHRPEGIELHGLIADVEGQPLVRVSRMGEASSPDALGESAARELLDCGGKEILDRLRPTR